MVKNVADMMVNGLILIADTWPASARKKKTDGADFSNLLTRDRSQFALREPKAVVLEEEK